MTGINVGNERFCKRQIFYATFNLPMFSVSFFFFYVSALLIVQLGSGMKKTNTQTNKKNKKHLVMKGRVLA